MPPKVPSSSAAMSSSSVALPSSLTIKEDQIVLLETALSFIRDEIKQEKSKSKDHSAEHSTLQRETETLLKIRNLRAAVEREKQAIAAAVPVPAIDDAPYSPSQPAIDAPYSPTQPAFSPVAFSPARSEAATASPAAAAASPTRSEAAASPTRSEAADASDDDMKRPPGLPMPRGLAMKRALGPVAQPIEKKSKSIDFVPEDDELKEREATFGPGRQLMLIARPGARPVAADLQRQRDSFPDDVKKMVADLERRARDRPVGWLPSSMDQEKKYLMAFKDNGNLAYLFVEKGFLLLYVPGLGLEAVVSDVPEMSRRCHDWGQTMFKGEFMLLENGKSVFMASALVIKNEHLLGDAPLETRWQLAKALIGRLTAGVDQDRDFFLACKELYTPEEMRQRIMAMKVGCVCVQSYTNIHTFTHLNTQHTYAHKTHNTLTHTHKTHNTLQPCQQR